MIWIVVFLVLSRLCLKFTLLHGKPNSSSREMVLLVVASDYVGFPSTKLALIASEEGQSGELRLTYGGILQFRVYVPMDMIQATAHLSIPSALVDDTETYVLGCEARVVTTTGHEYWFRFLTDASATLFAKILDSFGEIGRAHV